MTRNIFSIVAVLIIYLSYLLLISEQIPADNRLLVNFLIVPIVLGACGAIALSSQTGVLTRIALIAIVPVLPILVFGGDPAKPGMEVILIGPMALMFAVGAGVGIAIQMTLQRK